MSVHGMLYVIIGIAVLGVVALGTYQEYFVEESVFFPGFGRPSTTILN